MSRNLLAQPVHLDEADETSLEGGVEATLSGSARVPMYKIGYALALAVSLLAAWSDSMQVTRVALCCGGFVAAYALLGDCMFMWKNGRIVGRLTINVGIVFWFWLGAFESAFQNPPFPTPERLYLGFASVVPMEVVARGLICVNLFALMAEIGWQQLPQPKKTIHRLACRYDPSSVTWIDLVALALSLLGWVPIMIAYQGDMATALHDMLRMRGGGAIGASRTAGLSNHLHLLGLFGGALALARTVLRSKGLPPARYLAFGICFPLVFLGSSRFNLGFLFLPSLLILVAPVRHFILWNRRRRIAFTLTLAVGILVLFQGGVRTIGLGPQFRRHDSTLAEKFKSGWVGHDHFGAMLIAIDLVDSSKGFMMEPIGPFFLTHYIPRQFWRDKPSSASWTKYNDAVTRGRTFNVTPSITGQYYMNWGYFGVAYIGLFMGWLARCCETWFFELEVRNQLMSATVAGLMLAFVFLSFRFFHPLYFAYPLFAFITYIGLTRKVRNV